MTSVTRTVALAGCVLLAALRPAVAREEPEILAEVTLRGRPVEQVYEGQSVLYVVTLNHVDNPSAPELRGFDDFEIESLGERSLDSTQVTVINGRMTRVVRRGREYRYRLTPRKTGELRIPAPVAKADGRVLEGPERLLRVVPADKQDVVYLEITADRKSAYPTQPFSVTLSVAVRGLPEPHSDRDPVSVQRELRHRPPALQVPWLDGDALPDGLEPDADLSRWAAPLLNRERTGFSINGLTTQGSSLFSVFDEPEPAMFLPESRKVIREDKSGNDATYRQYDFVRTFTPKKIGRYTFGPATLEGAFVTEADEEGKVAVEEIYAVARPVEVIVKDVPEKGRPDSYVGAVGRFELSADLAPTKAKVGDPLTLALTLRGKGTLESIFAPDIAAMTEIAARFKVYEATEETKSDHCRFTYGLRPLEAGIEAFPSVPVSYFDAESERYVTLHTDPIPLEVTPAEQLSDDQIVATPGGASRKPRDLEARREGVFANVTDPGALRDESVHPGRWLGALGGMAGLYAIVALATFYLRRLSADQALLRRRGAVARAREHLRQSRSELERGNVRQGADLVEDSLVGLVADVADLAEAGLTPKDVCAELRALGLEEDLVGRVARLLETCDATRYGASNQADGFRHKAQAVLDEVIVSLKAKRRLR